MSNGVQIKETDTSEVDSNVVTQEEEKWQEAVVWLRYLSSVSRNLLHKRARQQTDLLPYLSTALPSGPNHVHDY
jgi:hypothetical protein